jgi:hypothetical protein
MEGVFQIAFMIRAGAYSFQGLVARGVFLPRAGACDANQRRHASCFITNLLFITTLLFILH